MGKVPNACYKNFLLFPQGSQPVREKSYQLSSILNRNTLKVKRFICVPQGNTFGMERKTYRFTTRSRQSSTARTLRNKWQVSECR